jgi:AraC-like DNA-binding protein
VGGKSDKETTVNDPGLHQAVIPTSVLAGLVEIGQRGGCPIDRWLDGIGVSADQLVEPTTKVSFRQVVTVLTRALRDLPPGPVGMQVGGRDALVSFGMLGVAIRSCSVGAEALAIGLELSQASGSITDPVAEFYDGAVAIRLHERAPEPALLPFMCEEAFTGIVLLVRSLFGTGMEPTLLELGYPRPAYAAEYERFFRCPIRYDADANRLSLPRALLEAPISTKDPANRALAVQACRSLIGAGPAKVDVVAAVESLLGHNLRAPATMAEVAASLFVTERTLRRQLAEAGDGFTAIRDRVRERRATFLLRESTLPVSAIAREVGFSDGREFRRAYRRWTGRTPSQTRTPSPGRRRLYHHQAG